MPKSNGGLSSLIPDSDAVETKTNKKAKVKSKKEPKTKKPKTSVDSGNVNLLLNEDKIEEIKEDVLKNPRISLWSVKSAATFKYLKKTIPEFSISKEASILLEDAISSKYPEIWELFEDME